MIKNTRDRAIQIMVWCLGLIFLVLPLVLDCPEGLDPRGFRALGVTALMAVLWVSEVLPIPVTSILPVVLFPLLGVMPSDVVSAQYTNDLTFLFFGGFFMALTIEKWQLHRRVALNLIVLFGTQPARTMLGIMIAVAVLSMWISNTATTLMMLPICIALCEELTGSGVNDESRVRFTTALLLSVAYAANIGGMGTPIGTAPNGIFQREFEGAGQPSFTEWMIMCVPLVCVFVVFVWFILRREFSNVTGEIGFGDRNLVRDRLKKIGKPTVQEKAVAVVFGFVVLLWVTRRDLTLGSFHLPGWVSGLKHLGVDWIAASAKDGIGDSAAAIVGVILLCVWRPGPDKAVLADWETAKGLPWGMLLLLGGGFAIAEAFQIGESSGDLLSLSAWIGNSLSSLEDAGAPVLVPAIAGIMSFMTELASNTATTSVVVPIVSQVGTESLGRLLAFAATLSASCAFMLPVATPPNAIVFASGRISIRAMIRAGLIINFIGILLISLTVLLLAANVLPKL